MTLGLRHEVCSGLRPTFHNTTGPVLRKGLRNRPVQGSQVPANQILVPPVQSHQGPGRSSKDMLGAGPQRSCQVITIVIHHHCHRYGGDISIGRWLVGSCWLSASHQQTIWSSATVQCPNGGLSLVPVLQSPIKQIVHWNPALLTREMGHNGF